MAYYTIVKGGTWWRRTCEPAGESWARQCTCM